VLHLEIIALRQQLAMIEERDRKRIRFRGHERMFWISLYRCWPDCLRTLRVFKPDTLVRWHRKGFRIFWCWKSRHARGGRPSIDPELRQLIRTMSRDNVGWGAPRIHGELSMLGINVSQATVAKFMVRCRKPPSQTWRTLLDNHVTDLVSVDFFTVPKATFRILYVYEHLIFCNTSLDQRRKVRLPTYIRTLADASRLLASDSYGLSARQLPYVFTSL